MKKCTKCKIEKLLSDFSDNKKLKSGKNSWCKNCVSKSTMAYNKLESSRGRLAASSRKHMLNKKYGITEEQYHLMFYNQNGLCAICGFQMLKEDICIDHDHKTGKVRGLLHRTCNAALGLFKENTDTLLNAIIYLNKNI